MEVAISKPKAPKPPDPVKTAAAQTGMNIDTAIANNAMGMINQVGPDGSLTYSQSGSHSWFDPTTGKSYTVPQYTATTSLSPEAARIRDLNNQTQESLAGLAKNQTQRVDRHLRERFDPNYLMYGTPDRSKIGLPDYQQFGEGLPTTSRQTNFEGFGAAPNGVNLQTGYEDDFSGHFDETYNRINERLDIASNEDRDRLRTELLNSGLREGTEAYDREMRNHFDRVTRGRTDAYLAAGQEQSRLLGEARNEAMFGNDARLGQFGADMALTSLDDGRRLQTDALRRDENRYQDGRDLTLFGAGQDVIARNNQLSQQQMTDALARADAIENQNQRKIEREYAHRNQSLNEISALMSGSQVATPQFNMAQSAMIPTTDFAGISQQGYANQMANYNAQMAPYNAAMGGLFGLGGSYLMGGNPLPFGGGRSTGGGIGGMMNKALNSYTGFSKG